MANGGFFGGIASGMATRQEMGLRARALGLQEQGLADERKRDLITQADTAISNTLDLIGTTVKGISESTALSGGLPEYREAIASIESAGTGGYQALGPVVTKDDGSTDRAFGRYQVMGANIPEWTREVLGKEMSPEEFLASQAAQDAVFDAKFGQFIEQTGNAADAASIWFTGRPLAEAATASDALGTTGLDYVRKFEQSLAGIPHQKMTKAIGPLLADVEELATKTGRDPKRYRNQVEAMIAGTPIGAAKAVAEGEAAAQKRIAEANGLIRAGIRKADALAAAGVKTTGPDGSETIDPEKVATIEAGMRKEYSGLAKTFLDTRDAFGRIEAAATNPTPAGDVSLIFAYMKMLDPGSTVREGEFATAQDTTGVPGQIINLYNQAIAGARLNETQRADFVSQARKLFNVAQKQHGVLTDQFANIAKRTGVNPENVTVDFSRDEPDAADNDPLGIR